MLTPIPSAEIDIRLRRHLDPDERVLWQGRPKQGSFFGPGAVATGISLVLVGTLLSLGLSVGVLPAGARFPLAAACALAGLVILGTGWCRRAPLWVYGVTDKRLLSVLGDKLIRSVTPAQLDRLTLNVRGDTVYWFRIHANQTMPHDRGLLRGPDGQFIGFHGQSDAQAVKAMIEAWRLAISRRAAGTAASFSLTMAAADRSDEGQDSLDGVCRIRHPLTGLTMDMPATWQALVSTRTDGPLQLFGVTVFSRWVRETDKRSYTPDADWNCLLVQAAPEAGLEVILHNAPQAITLDGVLNDPWAKLANAPVARMEPELRIGPFSGFGVVRTLPGGAQIRSNAALSAPAMMHQMWLEGEGYRLELKGYALEGQADIQSAIEAMIASLRLS
ncbi:hypothetical protein C8N35_1127 [Breoghania corrubedonensis]|uniref:Uncharacterized protein n=1 Tax=Breoghania corrubedonensis TaxID=665038 RepID=A0A2T5UW05_9HYPH|nr:hypothetical protein [Breoghania corrubedonensis]PTW55684.1 hypothetical protein C8N35_1127 [Breoghania corrubedonensis]